MKGSDAIRLPLALGLVGLSVALSGCAERTAAGPPPSQSTSFIAQPASPTSAPATPAASSAGSSIGAAVSPAPPAAPPGWVNAVRMERWTEAATLLDALPESERERPEIQYVRARVALASKDFARAAALLSGLEQRMPAISDDIARYRAEAAFEAGPHAEAAAYFARGTKARDLVRAAEAFERAGDTASARRAIDKAVSAAQRAKNRRDEAAAHAVRARLLQASPADAVALGDLRWLAVNAAAAPEGRAAEGALDRQKQPLSIKERIRAVEIMIELGSATEALAELERLGAIPGAPRRELAHLRASALFKARSYDEAAKAFLAAAGAKSGREAEQLMLSARALARAGHDDAAIKRYADVSLRYRSTPFGEQSAYLLARTLMQNGRYKDAEAAYTRYLAMFPKGADRDDAEVERALSMLSAGNSKAARKTLALLSSKAKGELVGKLRELEGVAALRAGDREGAVKIWAEVVRTYPLSWAALAARSRLLAAGAPVPPLLSELAEPKAKTPPVSAAAAPAPLTVALPRTAALLASLGLDADAESRIAANEHEAAAAYPGRESEALCGMYGTLSRAKRRYRVGIAAVSYTTLMRAPAAEERWAWECLYPRPYAEPAQALEEQHGMPRGLLHALMRQESAFDPTIVSHASAVGLMQLIPPTASRVATELSMSYDPALLTSPEVNLKLGAFYMSKLLKIFQGNLTLASAAYNAGPLAVSHWLEIGADNDADLWVARIPYEETRNYVARVAGNLARYQWLAGGDSAVTPLPLEIPAGARAPSDAY